MEVVDTASLESLIAEALPGAKVSAVDLRGSGDHFEVKVVSELFAGRSPVEQHRMVYEALGEAMGGEIHALTIEALTPAEAGQTGQGEEN